MKKVISKKRGKCPICGKQGLIKMYDRAEGTGIGFVEHKRFKTDLIVMGQYVTQVDGCLIPENKPIIPTRDNAVGVTWSDKKN